MPADTVMASSTSGLIMSEMQAGLRSAARFVVGHPFNPPHLIPLVEVVGGRETSPETVAWCCWPVPRQLEAQRSYAAVGVANAEGRCPAPSACEVPRAAPGRRFPDPRASLEPHHGGGQGKVCRVAGGPADGGRLGSVAKPCINIHSFRATICAGRSKRGDQPGAGSEERGAATRPQAAALERKRACHPCEENGRP